MDDPNYMKFFNDGAVTFPCKSHGLWFLTQHHRWGLIDKPIDYLAVVEQVNQIDLYREAAKKLGVEVPVPKDPSASSRQALRRDRV
ncbi:MAG: hypothetical protein MPW14_14425 [Candidatus Manganitrophus sp.]|nr:MAG: hypothetical protein MPW14_14425 [Candidatus Manganitrophus sp.]